MQHKSVLANIILTFILALPVVAEEAPKELPVCELTVQGTNYTSTLLEVFGIGGENQTQINTSNESIIINSDSKSLEISGSRIFFFDKNYLWNLSQENLTNVSEIDVINLSNGLLNDLYSSINLYVNESNNIYLFWNFENISGSKLIEYVVDPRERLTAKKIDSQVYYLLKLNIGNFNYTIIDFPEANVILGESNKLIGFNGPNQILSSKLKGYYKVIPEPISLIKYESLMKKAKPKNGNGMLEYFLYSLGENRFYLIPVYAYYNITGIIIIPAIDLNDIGINPHDFPKAYLNETHTGSSRGNQVEVLEITTDPDVETETVAGQQSGGQLYEAEAYYLESISDPFDLDAANFLGELDENIWTIGSAHKAYISNFTKNENVDIDAKDIIFHAGHGYGTAGLECENDNDPTKYAYFRGNSSYGDKDIEWLIADSCEILEDKIISKSGANVSVFDWTELFNGLHMLLGYGNMINTSKNTGSTFVQHMKAQNTIIYSWFITAKQIQNNHDIWAGALFPYNESASPYNDHLWGYGWVSPDIKKPDGFIAIYTPC